MRQTALLFGVPSWTQRKVDSVNGGKNPYFPVIPSLAIDPAYATSPLFRARQEGKSRTAKAQFRISEHVEIPPSRLCLPDISVISSLKKRCPRKEVLKKRLLILALATGIGLAPIVASPQRAYAASTTRSFHAAPQIRVMTDTRLLFRLPEMEHWLLERQILDGIQTIRNKIVARSSPTIATREEKMTEGDINLDSLSTSSEQQQPIEYQHRGGHYEASTIISSTSGRQITSMLPYLYMKLTVLAVLVVAAIMGGLDEVSVSLRNKLGKEWRETVAAAKDVDFESMSKAFTLNKEKRASDMKRRAAKIVLSNPIAYRILDEKVYTWRQDQQFMLRKSPSKAEPSSKRIMLKRSEEQGSVQSSISNSPLLSTNQNNAIDPNTTRSTESTQSARSDEFVASPIMKEIQSKYATKYVGLKRNSNSPILAYSIDDRPSQPRQKTVSIGLKRSQSQTNDRLS